MSKVLVEKQGPVTVVTINRPEARNAVDPETSRLLVDAFVDFEGDEEALVAILTGAGGTFCAGADLKAVGVGDLTSFGPIQPPLESLSEDGPMGPSYMRLSKPTIAAVSGFAVAGGLELSIWCDLRVVEEDATFGVYCRRWGVPLVDGGTVRLPRLIGHSNAMDMILTGRAVGADEAKTMGLANRVVPPGAGLEESLKLAEQIARFPQQCMRNDRLSACEQWGMDYESAMANESRYGIETLRSGETVVGAQRFSGGKGRSGSFEDI